MQCPIAFCYVSSMIRLVGAAQVESISDQVHPDLATPADQVGKFYSCIYCFTCVVQLCRSVGEYGAVCEKLIMKYRKNIISKSSSHVLFYSNILLIFQWSSLFYSVWLMPLLTFMEWLQYCQGT